MVVYGKSDCGPCPIWNLDWLVTKAMHHGKTSMNDIFVRKYRRKIESKTVLSSNGICMLWTEFCKRAYRLTQYSVICVKFPAYSGNAGKWKTVLVHRLMYMLHHNL